MKYTGIWQGRVDTSLFKGGAIVEIFDDNGKYGFTVKVEGIDRIPEFSVYDITEGENSLCGKAEVNVFGTVQADISVTFDGDSFDGFIRVPVLGKVPILDGRRIG